MSTLVRLAAPFFLVLLMLTPAAPLLAQDTAPPTGPTPEEIQELQEHALDIQRQAIEQFSVGAGATMATFLVGAVIIALVNAVVMAVFAVLIYIPYNKLPAEHQKMPPIYVFLIVIPLFVYIWSFIMTSKVSGSFKNYFDSVGDTTIGDAGKALGLWFSICFIAAFALALTCILSFLSLPATIAALVLFILYVVKLWGMAGKLAQPAPPAV